MKTSFLSKTRKVFSNVKERSNEKGSILVFYVLMFPVFLALAGVAIDGSIVASTQAQLQSALDAATQGTVALSKNQTGTSNRPQLTYNEAKQNVVRLYDANRSGIYSDRSNSESIPFLQCQTSAPEGGATLQTAPQSNCSFAMYPIKYSPTGNLANGGYLTVTVQEKADTIFLQFLGINHLTYTITSTARLTESYN